MRKIELNWALLSAILVVLTFSMVVLAGQAVQAAPLVQIPIYTPTPGPDGRIIYIVKENDTLLSISLITGVSVDELRKLNNLSDDFIFPGQNLLLGLAGPPPTQPVAPGPTATPTAIVPTPTPQLGVGELCLLLFNDINGDSLRQEDEPSIPGGALSISNRSGTVSITEDTTTGEEARCWEDLIEDSYTISAAVPEGYNPTTETSLNLVLQAGDISYVDFGAQLNSVTIVESPLPTEENKSPLLGIVGGLFLIAGTGLALFAGRLLKAK